MLRKQNKTNAEREAETPEMSAAQRNRRSDIQPTKTHDRWQQITSYAPQRFNYGKFGDG
jgi:hypothetical protein